MEKLIERVPPTALLLISRALQALATPIVALLIATAGSLGEDAKNAVSYCNVLFVGNLCAALVVLLTFGPRPVRAGFQRLGVRKWWVVILFGAISATLSAFIYSALETTMVTNAVLLSRLGPVLFVIGSALALGQPIGRSERFGFGLIVVGVLATVFTGSGFTLKQGDYLILASTVLYAMVTILGKRLLPDMGLASLIFSRNFFSAVVFFILANILYGFDHFAHAFSGPLWAIMMVYAAIVVVIGQLTWYRAIDVLPAATVARWTAVVPIIAVTYAYVLNGERPSQTQLAALGFITVGILVSNLGRFVPKGAPESGETAVAAS